MRTKPVVTYTEYGNQMTDSLDSISVLTDEDKYVIYLNVFYEFEQVTINVSVWEFDNADEANLQASLMGDMLGCNCFLWRGD